MQASRDEEYSDIFRGLYADTPHRTTTYYRLHLAKVALILQGYAFPRQQQQSCTP